MIRVLLSDSSYAVGEGHGLDAVEGRAVETLLAVLRMQRQCPRVHE